MNRKLEMDKRRAKMLVEAEDETGFEDAMFCKRGFVFRQTDLRPCICGREPVLEPWIRSKPGRQEWSIRCPACDRHTEPSRDYEEVRDRWNNRCFTENSEKLNRPLRKIDKFGMEMLICDILEMDKITVRAIIEVEKQAARRARELMARKLKRQSKKRPREKFPGTDNEDRRQA